MKNINFSIQSKSCILISHLFNEEKNKKSIVINNISEALNYLDKGKFALIDSDKIKSEFQKTFTKHQYYKKNNNIIIEFGDNEGKGLLFMNTKEDLKYYDINNIFVVDLSQYKKNQFKLPFFNDILICNNIKEIFDNITNLVITSAINYNKKISPNKKILSSSYNTNNNVIPKKKENQEISIEIKDVTKLKPENKKKQINSMPRQKSAPNKVDNNMKIQNFQITKNDINIKHNFNIFKNKGIQQKFGMPKILSFLNNQGLSKQRSNNNLKVNSNLNFNNINSNINSNINQKANNNMIVSIKKKNKIVMRQGSIMNKENNIIIKKDPRNNENKPEEPLNKIMKLNNLYNQQNEILKNENSRLKESERELRILKDELIVKKEELEKQIKYNNELKSTINGLKNNNEKSKKSLDEEITKKNKAIEKLKKEINELHEKSREIIENQKNKDDKIKELQEKIQQLESQVKIDKEKISQKDKELNNNKKIIKQLSEEINKLKETIKIKDNEINKLEKKIKELEELINKLKVNKNQSQLKLSLQNIRNTEEELVNSTKNDTDPNLITSKQEYLENRKKNNKITIVAKNIETDKNQNILNEKNIKGLKEKSEEDKNKLEEIQALKNEIINLKKTLNSLNKENNELKNIEKELENKIFLLNQKESEISNLKSKNKELEKRNETQSKILNDYQSKISKCYNEIENSNKKIEDLTKQIKEFQNDDNKRNINLANKEKEINLRLNEINKKEKELNNKALFLENLENLLESENQKIQKTNLYIEQIMKENNNLKIQNNNLMQQNQQLQNQILNYKQLFSKMQPNQNIPPNNMNSMVPINQNLILPPNNNQQNNFFMNFNNQIINNNNANMNKNMINNNNNSHKVVKKNIEPEPIKLYAKPTLIGLNNIGATCFMNATLQCLSQTEALTNYFLKEKNKTKIINNNIAKENKNDYQLSPVYLELIQKLWEVNGPKSFSPNNFMKRINDMNPLFKRGEAGDAKDFIIFILEQLHRELKMPVKSSQNNKVEEIPLNQYDKMNAFNNFFEEFKKETSILTDTFFGFNETTNICLYCKNEYNSKGMENPICYNYGIFNVLIFPLEEVKNMKMNILKQNNINMIQNNQVNLYECFSYNEKTDLFTGENKNYCNICKQLYDSHYTSKIFISPNVLILILNRGKNNIFKVKLDFQQTIDITDFIIQKEKPRIKYNLYGVITHLGESGPNAHFVASCKSPVDGNWYRYNDAFVDPINNFQKDVYDYGNPYILFYQKV